MKLILAIIRPEKFRRVKEELAKADVHMMTVVDVRGCGRQKSYIEEFRGLSEEIDLHRKVMILVGVNDSFVQSTIDVIIKFSRTNGGNVGDGKIFVLPLFDCVRISNGEKGVIAIGGDSKEARDVNKGGRDYE